MIEFILTHEQTLRLGVFLGFLLLLSCLEWVFPKRVRVQNRLLRWGNHALISFVNTFVLYLLGPLIAVSVALWASAQGVGLFHKLNLPVWAELILTLILFDLAIYAQHVATHYVKPLWALHKVHHTDRDLDASSALRFHPVEIMLSMLYKCVMVVLIGPAVFAVILYEILLNCFAIFNHANLSVPRTLDRVLRVFIVTPDMHRVHHSVIETETNSNFGNFLSIWDRLFKTYTAEPRAGHEGMTLGLTEYQHDQTAHPLWSFALPFRRR